MRVHPLVPADGNLTVAAVERTVHLSARGVRCLAWRPSWKCKLLAPRRASRRRLAGLTEVTRQDSVHPGEGPFHAATLVPYIALPCASPCRAAFSPSARSRHSRNATPSSRPDARCTSRCCRGQVSPPASNVRTRRGLPLREPVTAGERGRQAAKPATDRDPDRRSTSAAIHPRQGRGRRPPDAVEGITSS